MYRAPLAIQGVAGTAVTVKSIQHKIHGQFVASADRRPGSRHVSRGRHVSREPETEYSDYNEGSSEASSASTGGCLNDCVSDCVAITQLTAYRDCETVDCAKTELIINEIYFFFYSSQILSVYDLICAPFFFLPSINIHFIPMILVFYQPQQLGLSGSDSKSPLGVEKADSIKVSAYITRWRFELLKVILF